MNTKQNKTTIRQRARFAHEKKRWSDDFYALVNIVQELIEALLSACLAEKTLFLMRYAKI